MKNFFLFLCLFCCFLGTMNANAKVLYNINDGKNKITSIIGEVNPFKISETTGQSRPRSDDPTENITCSLRDDSGNPVFGKFKASFDSRGGYIERTTDAFDTESIWTSEETRKHNTIYILVQIPSCYDHAWIECKLNNINNKINN